MNKLFFILYFLVMYIVFISCTSIIEVDIDFEKNKVINCLIENGKAMDLQIFESINLSDSLSFKRICDASGMVYDENNNLPISVANCTYSMNDSFSLTSESINLQMEVEDASILSTTKLPKRQETNFVVENINLVNKYTQSYLDNENNVIFTQYHSYEIKSTIACSEGFEYLANVGFSLRYFTLDEKLLTAASDMVDIPFFRNNQFFGEASVISEIYANINSISIVSYVNVADTISSITLYTGIYGVNEDLYDYVLRNNEHKNTINDPFVQPVFPYNNIEGGLGVFAAYWANRDSVMIDLPQ